MKGPRGTSADPELLTRDREEHLLSRAAELDGAQSTQVGTLRAAAIEAGIQPEAFDAALAEVRAGGATPAQSPRGWLMLSGALGVAVLLAFGIVAASIDVRPSVRTVEQTFMLRCLAPGDAAAVVRPLMNSAASQIVISPHAPHVLTVRTTPDQMQRVRAALDRQDGAACQTPATNR
jgi:hypothetical protein